jgi:hypothetical protein
MLLANLLQTVCQLESVGEVLLGAPRNMSTEVPILEAVEIFLQVIQCAILLYHLVITDLCSSR